MLQEVLNLGALASGNAVVQIISIILGILLYLYKDEIKAFAKSKGIFKDIARILKLSDRVRKDLKILATALEDGKITPDEAIELANLYAPEHLSLMVDKADAYIDKVSNAGCICIGENSTVVLSDYVAGPSHVLPTGGTARFSSPLNITDFIKFINLVEVDEAGLREMGQAASTIARAEGFEAHARAVEERLKEG